MPTDTGPHEGSISILLHIKRSEMTTIVFNVRVISSPAMDFHILVHRKAERLVYTHTHKIMWLTWSPASMSWCPSFKRRLTVSKSPSLDALMSAVCVWVCVHACMYACVCGWVGREGHCNQLHYLPWRTCHKIRKFIWEYGSTVCFLHWKCCINAATYAK